MARAIILLLDSLGVGGAPDAARFGDEGANTWAISPGPVRREAEGRPNRGVTARWPFPIWRRWVWPMPPS